MKAIMFALLLAGCGGGESCKDDEVEVDYFKDHKVATTQCKPLPASCNGVGDCSVQACIRDMYNLCDPGHLGEGCSDTFPPTIITCQ